MSATRARPRGSFAPWAPTTRSSSLASFTTARSPLTRSSGIASRECCSRVSPRACGLASGAAIRRSRAISTTPAAVPVSRRPTEHPTALCASLRATMSVRPAPTTCFSRAPTARPYRDGLTGPARHRRGIRRPARFAPRARRGKKARHPHRASWRSRGRVPRSRAGDALASRRRGLRVPRARLTAGAAQGAQSPAEPRAAGRGGERVRGGAATPSAGIRGGARARGPAWRTAARGRARVPSRRRDDRAAAARRRGRCAGVGWVARPRARSPAWRARGGHHRSRRALLRRATHRRDRGARGRAGQGQLRYAPRRSTDRRVRRRDLHRAARPLPSRRDRSLAGRAVRRHSHHREGTLIRSELANAVEAVLFVAEKPVGRSELGRIVGGTPRAVENALAGLGTSYEGTRLRLQRPGDEWQIVTATEHAPQVAAYLGADRLRLSAASLETLSVIAYRQPVTRAEVEAIRGVNCDQTIYTLASRRLIEERGRKEAPGRPILYGTTWEFLECFGLQSLDDLPRALSPEGVLVPGA